jgi:hypothetical protein
MSQEKISAAQAAQVYSEVPGVLRALISERDDLTTKLAAVQQQLDEYRTRDRIEKIASAMGEKNLDTGSSFEERIERIKEAAARGRSLDVIEEAVQLSAPSGGLGKLAEAPDGGAGGQQLEAYLLGGLSD